MSEVEGPSAIPTTAFGLLFSSENASPLNPPVWSKATSRPTASPTSLLRFIFAEQNRTSCSTDLTELLNSIQAAIKAVSAALRFGCLSGDKRSAEVKAAEIFSNFIQSTHSACMILTPDRQISLGSENEKRGKYAVYLQPLEGTFCGMQMPLFAGSVFGIHKISDGRGSKAAEKTWRSPLIQGRHLVAAGYALYGSNTVLVLSMGPTSNLFTLDPAIGEFMLSPKIITVPSRGHTYNIDEGRTYEWDPSIVDFIESKKDPKLGKPYRSQHLGCIIADVHSILLQGGICILPRTRSQPNGQHSVLTCLAPLAYIACAAGGLASNGEVALLDFCPESSAQTTAAFIGSREDVRELLSCLHRRFKPTLKAKTVQTVEPNSHRRNKIQFTIKHDSGSCTSSSCQSRCSDDARDEPNTNKFVQFIQPVSHKDPDHVKHKQVPPFANLAAPSSFTPVTPYTTMKNDRVRLTWPVLGNLLRNQIQQRP